MPGPAVLQSPHGEGREDFTDGLTHIYVSKVEDDFVGGKEG